MAKLFEQLQIIDMTGVGTLDIDTDTTTDYISVANYRRGGIIFTAPAGTSGDDWNIVVRQATVAAGSDAKDADIVDEYFTKQAATNLTAVEVFTRTSQTLDALVAGNSTSGAEVATVWIPLDFARLDTNNGFTFVACDLSQDASSAAQVCACILVLFDPRYPQAIPVGALT